jgi:hypothetical protein
VQVLKKFTKLAIHKQKALAIYAGKGFTEEGVDQLEHFAHTEKLTLNFVDRARPTIGSGTMHRRNATWAF